MYFVYVIRCIDNSLYTGITTDIDRRYYEHVTKSFRGAKYTRNHTVIKLEVCFKCNSRSLASKLEYYIKRLSKKDKEFIIISKCLDILSDNIDVSMYEFYK